MKEHFISVIVPAYNEQKAVAGVLQALIDSKVIDEVICVNDGSTDNTLETINQFKDEVKIINLINNMGKGYAMARGIEVAKGDLVVFLDADITNLNDTYIKQLLKPVLDGTHIGAIGVLVNQAGFTFNSELAGQRVYFKKDLEPLLEVIEQTRFGVETYLNGAFDRNKIAKFKIKGLKSLYKYEKQPPQEAVKEYVKEGIEIAKVLANTEIIPEKDIKILGELAKLENYQKFDQKIQELTSIKIRDVLQNYFEKYLKEFNYKIRNSSKKDSDNDQISTGQ